MSGMRLTAVASLCLGLAACGGGGGPAPAATYTVAGSVTGLAGDGVGLRGVSSTGANVTLNVSGNGSFQLSGLALASGATYTVTVASQPTSPWQTCTVANGQGTVGSANVTNVQVSCTTNSYAVSATVSGLAGSGLVLRNNGADDLTVAADGAVTFATSVASGDAYAVTVATVPEATPAQTCLVQGGSGTMTNADIDTVVVSCRPITSRFLYTMNSGAGNVSAFSIDPDTGELTEIAGSPFTVTGDPPRTPYADPSERFLYINGAADPNVDAPTTLTGYAIDAVTGALTAIGGFPLALPASMRSVAFHPNGQLVYSAVGDAGAASANHAIYGFSIDSTTGELTDVPGSPNIVGTDDVYMGFLSIDPAGLHLYASVSQPALGVAYGYSIDATTGALASLGPLAAVGTFINRAVLSPSGAFYYMGLNNNGTGVFAVDAMTGALAPLAGVPTARGTGAVFTRGGERVYFDSNGLTVVNGVPTPGPGSVAGYDVDLATGALTELSGSPYETLGNSAASIRVDPTERYIVVSNTDMTTGPATTAVFSIADDGTLTHVPGSPFVPAVGSSPGAVAFDRSGQYAYISDIADNSVSAYRIDGATGVPQFIASYPTGAGPTELMKIVGQQ